MPKYPTNYNDPSLTPNNITVHTEIKDNVVTTRATPEHLPSDNTIGRSTLTNSTDMVGDLTTVLTALGSEITTYTSNITAGSLGTSEKALFANMEQIKIKYFLRNALHMAFWLRRVNAMITDADASGDVTGALGAPSTSKYPSAQNRGY